MTKSPNYIKVFVYVKLNKTPFETSNTLASLKRSSKNKALHKIRNNQKLNDTGHQTPPHTTPLTMYV
jgi:hypothetical protein